MISLTWFNCQRAPPEMLVTLCCGAGLQGRLAFRLSIWVVVKIMVPVRIPVIIRHLIFRVPKKGP